MWTSEEFEAAVRGHDARIASLGLTIWVGSEPTFTDRTAQSPEWLHQALGGDKEQRAKALLGGLCCRFPGGLVLRSVGRQYPGEERPRWNLGLYRRRDGAPIWHGPPDPVLAASAAAVPCDLDAWAAALAAELEARGLPVAPVAMEDALERRLLMRAAAAVPAPDATDPRLARPSVHARTTAPGGLRVLVVTTFNLDQYVFEALRAGASGFLLKDTPAETMIEGIRVVAAGHALIAPEVTRDLIGRFGGRVRERDGGRADQVLAELTEREIDVLRLIAAGLSNPEIAAALFISRETVKTYVSRILAKLGLRDRIHAVVLAHRIGLFTDEP